MENNNVKTPRMPKLWEALLVLGLLIAVLAVGIIVYGVDPHIPMFVGTIAAALMALHLGYKWSEVEKSMLDGIYKALQSIIILAVAGILVGVVTALIGFVVGTEYLNPITYALFVLILLVRPNGLFTKASSVARKL